MSHPDLAQFPVVIELNVAWGDMDSYAHVNNVVYFRYFESARIAYLDRVGWSASKETTGLGPILASTSARFRKPVTYPDHLLVGARVSDIQPDRVTFDFRLVSTKLNAISVRGARSDRELRLRGGEEGARPGGDSRGDSESGRHEMNDARRSHSPSVAKYRVPYLFTSTMKKSRGLRTKV